MTRRVLGATILAALVVSCGRSSSTAPPQGTIVEAGSPDGGQVDDPALAIADFAAAHGGRHAGPFQLPGERQLFFVGGDVAHGAWMVAKLGPTWATVFEPIDMPRAVRVLDVVVHEAKAYVLVESVAALDQPAGLRGVIALGEEGAPWTWADARSAAELRSRIDEPRPSLPAGWDDTTRFARASKSDAAASAEIGPEGVDVFEIWQRALVRKVEHIDRANVTTSPRVKAIRGFLERLSSGWGACRSESATCFIGHTGDSTNDEGAVLAADDGVAHIRALFLVPAAPKRDAPEVLSAATGGDVILETWRFSHDAPARILAQADLGGGRVIGVVDDENDAWIVERDGAFSRVTRVEAPHEWDDDLGRVGPNPGVRITDLDADGMADVLVWDPTTKVPRALVYRRTHLIDQGPQRDWFGTEVPMLGAGTLDEAESLARAPVVRASPKQAELCALSTRASTARGFRSLAAPGARLVVRHGSFTHGRIVRVIPAADVKDEDLGSLECAKGAVAGCFLEPHLLGLCEIGPDETQMVHPMLHWVRIGGALKLDVVSVFGE